MEPEKLLNQAIKFKKNNNFLSPEELFFSFNSFKKLNQINSFKKKHTLKCLIKLFECDIYSVILYDLLSNNNYSLKEWKKIETEIVKSRNDKEKARLNFVNNLTRYYHLSKYIISVDLGDDMLFVSTVSGSVIKLDHEKSINLKLFNVNVFEINELSKLIKMGFITSKDEYSMIQQTKKKVIDEIDKQPLGISILTTTGCNARCYYCYEKGIAIGNLNQTTANKIIDFIKKRYNDKEIHLAWFGGEPLLNNKIIDYICDELIKSNIKYYSSMISNGLLFSEISAERLKKWNLKKVQITLDGVDEKYDLVKKFVNVKKAFFLVVKNIHYLLDNNVSVVIRVNFDPDNLKISEEVIDFVYNEFGIKNKLLSIYCVNIVDDNIKSSFNFSNETNPQLYLTKKLIDYGYIKNIVSLGIRPKKTYCGIYHNYYVVDPNGAVFKCEHTCKDLSETIGNVDQEFDKTKISKWLSLSNPFQECDSCVLYPCCQGGCKSLAEKYGMDRVCMPCKNYVEEVIKYLYNKKQE